VGHHFWKVSVLAILPSKFYPKKLSGHQMPINWSSMVGWPKSLRDNWSASIVACLRGLLGHFHKSRYFNLFKLTRHISTRLAISVGASYPPFHPLLDVQVPVLASLLEWCSKLGVWLLWHDSVVLSIARDWRFEIIRYVHCRRIPHYLTIAGIRWN